MDNFFVHPISRVMDPYIYMAWTDKCFGQKELHWYLLLPDLCSSRGRRAEKKGFVKNLTSPGSIKNSYNMYAYMFWNGCSSLFISYIHLLIPGSSDKCNFCLSVGLLGEFWQKYYTQTEDPGIFYSVLHAGLDPKTLKKWRLRALRIWVLTSKNEGYRFQHGRLCKCWMSHSWTKAWWIAGWVHEECCHQHAASSS